MHSPDWSCRYYIQDVFFWRLAGLVAKTLICLYLRDFVEISTHRVSNRCTNGNFQKKFPLPKNGGHFEFSAFCQKYKFSSISITVQDRAILLKFLTWRVSQQFTLANFVQVLEENSNSIYILFLCIKALFLVILANCPDILISKSNFYELIPNLMDMTGPPS